MRTDNLIQAYINKDSRSKQYNTDKAVKSFDVHKELANRTFIKPLPGNGKLVRPSIFDMPSEIAKGWKYDWNAFRHAIKGNANDHELGKLNDVGLKVGGLAIASYLYTKKGTPMTKVFEFIGLGSFLGAMNLWPKLFLQLPARLVHGFDIRQKYEDNYGRKKMVFSDHQFIPWDLYSDKEINKIGDRLHVPKDIPNRRDFIQEKMRKIALQNNTMWMLTSGFAAPLMSALICNRLEGPVSKYLHNRKEKQCEALLTNFVQETAKSDFSKKETVLDNLLSENRGKTLTDDLVNNIIKNVTKGQDPLVRKAFTEDIKVRMPVGEHFTVSVDNFRPIRDAIKSVFEPAKLSEAELAKLLPDDESLLRVFNERGLMGSDIKEFSEHIKGVYELLEANVKELIAKDPNSKTSRQINFLLNKLIHQNKKGQDAPIETALKTMPSRVLTPEIETLLKESSSIFNELKGKARVLDKYSYVKVAQDQETVLADIWNSTADGFLKALKLTPEEITKAKIDSEVAGNILRNRIETIVADKNSCAELVSEMEKLLSVVYSKTSPMEEDSHLYHTLVDSTFDSAAESFKAKGLHRTVDMLAGYGKEGKTGLKGHYHEVMKERITGVKSSFYRLLQTINTYYKLAHVEGVEGSLKPSRLREVKEEMAELAKTTLLNGHTADFSVKLHQRRNLHPAKGDYSQIETSGGKVVNKYFGKIPASELVSLPNDSIYFNDVMKLIFSETHPDIADKIKSSVFYNDFQSFRWDALKKLGGEYNFAFPKVVVFENNVVESTSSQKFNRWGCASNELLYKLANNKFNSNKWFSVFGKLGAGVIAVTLLSQFFMGRMKKPEPAKGGN